jgi:hypothetical protein
MPSSQSDGINSWKWCEFFGRIELLGFNGDWRGFESGSQMECLRSWKLVMSLKLEGEKGWIINTGKQISLGSVLYFEKTLKVF